VVWWVIEPKTEELSGGRSQICCYRCRSGQFSVRGGPEVGIALDSMGMMEGRGLHEEVCGYQRIPTILRY
jgi:hypothetical protein